MIPTALLLRLPTSPARRRQARQQARLASARVLLTPARGGSAARRRRRRRGGGTAAAAAATAATVTAAGAAEQEPPSPAAPHGRTRTGGGGGRAHSAARFCFLLLRAPRRTGIYKSSALDQTYCKYRLCFCLFVGWGGRTALFVCLNRVLARDPPLSWPFWRERRACSDKKQTKLCANKQTGCFCFCCLVIQQPKFFGSFHTSKKQLPALFLVCCRALATCGSADAKGVMSGCFVSAGVYAGGFGGRKGWWVDM